jgi:hypothetical protein
MLFWPKVAQTEKLRIVDSHTHIRTEEKVPKLFITPAFQRIDFKDHSAFIAGDFICNRSMEQNTEDHHFDISRILKAVKGHYYLILVNEKNRNIKVCCSLFNIFPIFHHTDHDNIRISNQIHLISPGIETRLHVNKDFISEQLIFNYPLFNDSIYKNISLLKTNHYIDVTSNQLNIIRHTCIEDYLFNNQDHYKYDADTLCNYFIEHAKKYYPEDKSAISLTGGLDGRTLVAMAKYLKYNFITYTHGTQSNEDILYAKGIARKENIEHLTIRLDDRDYINSHEYLPLIDDITKLTNGFGNIIRLHYYYDSICVKSKAKYHLVGFFGSELFRAMHIVGSQLSKELFYFFSPDKDEWIQKLVKSNKWNLLYPDAKKDVSEKMIEKLIEYKNANKELSKYPAKFLYKYIFEEVFRKIFGSYIFAQFHHLPTRTPYLDIDFMKYLLSTKYAGANNSFFTNNPVKRMKGQYLYSKIMEKTDSSLLRHPLSKGYKPQDLLTSYGPLLITKGYIEKKYLNKKNDLDNLGIISGIESSKDIFNARIKESGIYNQDRLFELSGNLRHVDEADRDLYALAASMASYVINKG